MIKTKLLDGQKLPRQFREVTIDPASVDDENRIIRNVSVCSDEPYERFYGTEILTISEQAIDLARVKNGVAPLLFNHKRDAFLGKPFNPVIREGKLYVDLKFSNNPEAKQVLADLKDGLLTEFSIGYDVNRFDVDEDEETYTATRWTLYECSVVTIPADQTVGVGRNEQTENTISLSKKNIDSNLKSGKTESGNSQKSESSSMETPTLEDVNAAKAEGQKAERDRVASIQKLVKQFMEKGLGGRKIDTRELSIQCIAEGKTVEEFRNAVMDGTFPELKPINTGDENLLRENSSNGSGDDSPRIQLVSEREASGMIRRMKTVGKRFVESEQYREQGKNRKRNFSVDIPELTSFRATATTATITNFNGIVQLPEVIGLGVQQATVADLLAQGTTNLNAVPYLQEDTFTNAATTVAEGAAKPEATFDWSQTSAPVKKIAVIAKVSDELFADVPTIESYINERLRYMVDITEDAQLLVGDGIGSNITGIEATSGIQTQAKGADTVPDAVRKAMTKVQTVGFFAPDGIVMHPNDWETVQLLKDSAGQYLAGGPFYAPYGNGQYVMFYRFWGMPVVVTTSQTENTALVGAFKLGAMIFRRAGLTIDSTNSNEDDFEKNLITLRAEERLALAVWRPKAFCTVTGI